MDIQGERSGGRGPVPHGGHPEALTAVPARPVHRVLFRQWWQDVVLLHWEADPFEVARLLPPGTTPDLLHGRTYVGLVFFRMRDLAFGHLPPVPRLGTFTEVNVRLYSRDALGRRGVVFRSLDCDRLLPVLVARAAFGLPYRWSRTSRRWYGERLLYRTRGRGGRRTDAHVWVDVTREPVPPGPLDEFLTYRWGLHESVLGRTYYLPNTHPAWTFRRCALLGWDASAVAAAGLTPPAGDPVSVLYAPGVPVRFGPPARLAPTRRPGAGSPEAPTCKPGAANP
ncbi:YqjF family protein [Streptomyces sp. NPDC101171]|uniref:YqjF family protein n=1 Tax=Streptomyces sp. NPDC101171 TaxID=3366122 RepID=UPI00381C5B68